MLEPHRLHGVVVPMATPLKSDAQRVDPQVAAQLAVRLADGGVHGIFVAGTTGEGPLLGEEEWRELVLAVREATRGRTAVLAGVLTPGTAAACRLARVASRIGVDLVVATTPYYYPYTERELQRHFEAIAAASDVPVLVYNIPQNTKIHLPYSLCARLASSPAFAGLKDSSGDLDGLRTWLPQLREANPSFRVFLGTDHLVDLAVLFGADGIVPSLANVAPRAVVEAFQTATRRDWDAVGRHVWRLSRLMRVYDARTPRQTGIVVGVKCALDLLGVAVGPPALPTSPPTDDERRFVASVLRAEGLL